jgi:excisionase family DNA binding protein
MQERQKGGMDMIDETTRRAHGTHDQQPLLLSVPDAALLLGIGATLCWELVHSGQLETIRLGRRVLVPRSAVEKIAAVRKD